MNMKIKLLMTSLVVVMASGCSSYNGAGASQSGGYGASQSGGFGVPGTSVGTGSRGFGQSQRSNTSVVATDSCAVCAASKAQTTYTYKPATQPVVQPVQVTQPKAQSTHNQQYYIDRWNRQQAQLNTKQTTVVQQQPVAPVQQPQQNYNGYGQQQQSNTTYYDYSSASRANTQAPASNVTSNKSIYTGSYQQNSYTPTTYSGGSAATTNTSTSVNNSSSTYSGGGSGSTYAVKKGDTVFEIMRQTGVYWKDIISINNLQAPYNISPGQTLRLK